MTQLWHMNSDVLKGFYASEVFVAGSNKKDVIQAALRAYDDWVSEFVQRYQYHPLTKLDTDDPEYEEAAEIIRGQFHNEMDREFRQVPRRAMIFRW